MRILGMGVNYSTGGPLVEAMDEQAFGGRLLEALQENIDRMRHVEKARTVMPTFRAEVERSRTTDLGNPQAE